MKHAVQRQSSFHLLLRQQFCHSARAFVVFLNCTGVYLFYPDLKAPASSQNTLKLKKLLQWIWSWFWLLLNTQSGLFIFARRGYKYVFNILFDSKLLVGGMLTEQLNGAIMRVSALTFETLTHYMLIFSIRPTMRRFFVTLEPVYRELRSPDLLRVRLLSNICLIFTIWTVKSVI